MELDALTYEPAIEAVQIIFENHGYAVTLVDGDPAAEPNRQGPTENAASIASTRFIAAAIGAIVVLSVAAWFVLQ